MQRLFLLFILMSTSYLLPAQAPYWSGEVKWLWQRARFDPFPRERYQELEKVGDTTIQDKTCMILEERHLQDSLGRVTYFPGGYHHTVCYSGDTVWYAEKNDTLYPLFNFSLGAGDTLVSYCQNHQELVYYRIDSIGTMTINGVERKVQYLHEEPQLCGLGIVVEGLGGSGYFFPGTNLADPGPGGTLLCYRENGLAYPDTAVCEIISSSHEAAFPLVEVYPNPTPGLLTINNLPAQTILLHDSYGRRLGRFINSGQLDLSALPPGLYWLSAWVKGHRWSYRVVRQP